MGKLALKKWLKSVFIKKFVKPRAEHIDTPGFNTIHMGSGGAGKVLRVIYLPESFYAKCEDRFSEEYGREGDNANYRAGKRFGWRYTKISDYPSLRAESKAEIEKFMNFYMTWIEVLYAGKFNYSLDTDSKTANVETWDFSVCRKNGKGHFLLRGGLAGAFSYSLDADLEAYKPICEGRGDDHCEVNYASVEKLDEDPWVTAPDINEKAICDRYRRFNEARDLEGMESLKDKVRSGDFEYQKNIMHRGDQRYVQFECSALYILEQELADLDEELLFQIAFEEGEKIAEGEEEEFVSSYLTAIGMGEFDLEEKTLNYYPWTIYAEDVEFVIVRGLISGMLSEVRNEDIRFDSYEKTIDEALKIKLK